MKPVKGIYYGIKLKQQEERSRAKSFQKSFYDPPGNVKCD